MEELTVRSTRAKHPKLHSCPSLIPLTPKFSPIPLPREVPCRHAASDRRLTLFTLTSH